MDVFDGEVSELMWISGPNRKTIINLFKPEAGYLKEWAISGLVPPTNTELNTLIQKAKEMSKEEEGSIFIVLQQISILRESKSERFIPFAEFLDGKLVAFCRPPWRQGNETL